MVLYGYTLNIEIGVPQPLTKEQRAALMELVINHLEHLHTDAPAGAMLQPEITVLDPRMMETV